MTDDGRIAAARSLVGAQGDSWTCLGFGLEGVVLSDGRHVCKVFDGWADRAPSERTALWSLNERLLDGGLGATFLPLDTALERAGEHYVLWYHYESTTPYTGGHDGSLVDIVRCMRALGLLYLGYRPSSFRVGPRGLLLVDLGCDVVPLEEARWRHNLERAFLMARCADRSDLKVLQARALAEEILEELRGFPEFFAACEAGA
jgi:hypothetical protein